MAMENVGREIGFLLRIQVHHDQAASTFQQIAIEEDVVARDSEVESVLALLAEVSTSGGAPETEHGCGANTCGENRADSGNDKAGKGASESQAAAGPNHGAEKGSHALAHAIPLGIGRGQPAEIVFPLFAGYEAQGRGGKA